ncbi:major early-transcribed protein 53 [Ectropis obliqua nucleopolyhedrovirus]|uniref:Early 53 kDa protein n=1 Tax=Ectropis obliqua nucleopolyhedrovirus TaxID=59376 RepID=A0EYR6_9ABAC|nr:major early-transcribed protein 53 [Ectropis obliqua nucleopolyhedrovirus]ABI35697.1 major early-transcribed protein 53 [Ectropis obliqua nucleopolyhedrovirus]AGS47878.1 early 53 kDa protein [Ectropis obliqua nucleopolyhedrovirus]QWV59599.1 major early-transcribed protein 53 [Ectropis obliqua nucleopolyhedrovirus]UYO72805.1 major early-transcribed protein 53 [Ectropis obliqua nucleopolyhedrovirus]
MIKKFGAKTGTNMSLNEDINKGQTKKATVTSVNRNNQAVTRSMSATNNRPVSTGRVSSSMTSLSTATRKIAITRNDKLQFMDIRNEPSADAIPHDVRPYFLNIEVFQLMCDVINFAKQYVRGEYRLNNLVLMNCLDIKSVTDCVYVSKCDMCKINFKSITLPELHCVIQTAQDVKSHNKYRLVCGKCIATFVKDKVCTADGTSIESLDKTIVYTDRLLLQLYPKLTLDTLFLLCKHNFVTKYLFHIDLSFRVKKYSIIDDNFDVYKTFCKIIETKQANEQIVKITLRTYAQKLFKESAIGCQFVDSNNQFVVRFTKAESEMMNYINSNSFKPITYFYQVKKIVFNNDKHNYVSFFAKPFLQYNRRLMCNKCKTKFYKSNPILFCSKCGFINRMHFNKNIDNLDCDTINFYQECVKAVKTRLFCIVYYDMKLYETCSANTVTANIVDDKNK